jgi:hypothetical protein
MVIMVMVMMIPAIVVIVIAVRAVMMVMMPPTVMVMVIRSSVPDRLACRQWVKLRRTQCEHMFSALPLPNSDIARRSRHVSNVPRSDILLCLGKEGGAAN